MKINNITLQERILWIVGAGLIAFYAENQMKSVDGLQVLLTTYQMEASIQNAQIGDFSQQLNSAKDSSYSRGFEHGKTQASVAFVHGDTLYNYSDGYHAAISQFGIADPNGQGLSQDILLDMLLSSFPDESNETEDLIISVD